MRENVRILRQVRGRHGAEKRRHSLGVMSTSPLRNTFQAGCAGKSVVAKLTEDDMIAISAYLGSLAP